MKKIILEADSAKYSAAFAEEHKNVNGFSAWNVEIEISDETDRTFVTEVEARGTGVILIVSITKVLATVDLMPVCYAVPTFGISGYVCATETDTIYQIAAQMAKMDNNEIDHYRVDAISIGTAVYHLSKKLQEKW